MKLAAMQAYFFPYAGYFQLIHSADIFILYEFLPFRKKTWMSRNRLLPADGHIHDISIPIQSKSSNALIADTMISNHADWKKKLLADITNGYRNAQYFDECFPFIRSLLLDSEPTLHLYNAGIIERICGALNITTRIVKTNDGYKEFESAIKGDHTIPAKMLRIFEMCRKENAETFINAPGGTELYPKYVFQSHGITLRFIRPTLHAYRQWRNEFVPGLSIIDVLLHNGLAGTREYIKDYEFD